MKKYTKSKKKEILKNSLKSAVDKKLLKEVKTEICKMNKANLGEFKDNGGSIISNTKVLAKGIKNKDRKEVLSGTKNISKAVGKTGFKFVKGEVKKLCKISKDVGKIAHGVITEDEEKAKEQTRDLVKNIIISTFVIGD